jgi:hypothetical protein
MVRTIRSLLYEQGYTIGGARQRMSDDREPAMRPVEVQAVIQETIRELEEILELLGEAG